MIFDLSGLDEQEQRIITAALERCSFDFDQLRDGLERKTDRTSIPVEFIGGLDYTVDGDEDVRGLAWDDGKIQLDGDLVAEPTLAELTFMLESAHMVDFFLLTGAQREAIMDAYGATDWFDENGEQDYTRWAGEAFMEGFVKAFTDYSIESFGFEYESTTEVVKRIRETLAAGAMSGFIRQAFATRR